MNALTPELIMMIFVKNNTELLHDFISSDWLRSRRERQQAIHPRGSQ
jgi:hypothetical protein